MLSNLHNSRPFAILTTVLITVIIKLIAVVRRRIMFTEFFNNLKLYLTFHLNNDC